ncbi:MAG: hypothetical protein ACREEC_06405 [Thermoplasmata archaeon]
MTASPPEGSAPPSPVTRPDQIRPDAWRAVDLLAGEAPLQAWRTPGGYLLLTNLRCVALGRRGELFEAHLWQAGPEFFFYNLRPPHILLGRFVGLEEEYPENGWVDRFAVRDPPAVAAAILATMEPGRRAWQERRAKTEELLLARQRRRAQRAAGVGRPRVMVRCAYCGNLSDVSRRRCPSCGAALV